MIIIAGALCAISIVVLIVSGIRYLRVKDSGRKLSYSQLFLTASLTLFVSTQILLKALGLK